MFSFILVIFAFSISELNILTSFYVLRFARSILVFAAAGLVQPTKILEVNIHITFPPKKV